MSEARSSEGSRRTPSPFPFSVPLSLWRPWSPVRVDKLPVTWRLARSPGYERNYRGYHDLLLVDAQGVLWHRRIMSCAAMETSWFEVAKADGGPDWSRPHSVAAISAGVGELRIFALNGADLVTNAPSPSGMWSDPWNRIPVYVFPDDPFGMPKIGSAPIPVELNEASHVAAIHSPDDSAALDVFVVGTDGHVYSYANWRANIGLGWRKIDGSGVSLAATSTFEAVPGALFVADSGGALWAAVIDRSERHITPTWKNVAAPNVSVRKFAVSCDAGECRIGVLDAKGGVFAGRFADGGVTEWVPLDRAGPFTVPPDAELAWAAPLPGRFDLFTTGSDGLVYGVHWEAGAPVTDPSAWSPIGAEGTSIATRPSGGIAAVCRVKGQIEVLAVEVAGAIERTWFS